ncbi:MAG TPA: mismatch-specific DNA-glycosylase [Candidatus Manganitrophaceae bacterium]|nr:mismatch-specific DNA-glycosylase [Candidatus Manganitrophaceae bacterium]
MNASLPDILEGDLDIVFVGINPGAYSAQTGHYYARPSNLFWTTLHQSGLIPQPLQPKDDWKLPRFRIGLTDIVKRSTDSSQDLSADELKTGGEIVRKKILFYRPRTVCFNGLTAYRALFGPTEGPGAKEARIGSSALFVVPSTSRRNARYPKEEVILWFRRLKEFIDRTSDQDRTGAVR